MRAPASLGRIGPFAGIAATALIAVLAGGCLAPIGGPQTGDFGRPVTSPTYETAMMVTGKVIAMTREDEAVGWFPETDEEKELRDRAYALVMPNDPRDAFNRTLQEFQRQRILPYGRMRQDPKLYAMNLIATEQRSPVSLYRRLREEIEQDMALVMPFTVLAGQVADADAIRMQAMEALGKPREDQPVEIFHRQQAEARIAENAMLVDWVMTSVDDRTAGYRAALEMLVVQIPSREAIATERALLALERCLKELDRHAGGDAARPAPRIAKRGGKYFPGGKDEGLPRK